MRPGRAEDESYLDTGSRPGGTRGAILDLLDHPHYVVWCFGVFLALRVALIVFVPIEQASDAAWYYARAIGIASGQGYSEDGYPTAYWPVGYPGFLGVLFTLFGKHALVGQIANLALSAASFFIVLLLTRILFRSERAARLAVGLIAVYPDHIGYTPLLLNEIYFSFLLLLGSYIYIARKGWKWWIFSGLLFGLMALTKPQAVFVPAFLVLLGIWGPNYRERVLQALKAGAVLYAVMAATLIPWAVRNTLIFGEVVLVSTNGGVTLLIGNNPSADGGYLDDDPLIEQRNYSVKDQVAADRRAKQLALNWIKENPERFVALIPFKIFRLWAIDGGSKKAYERGYDSFSSTENIFITVRFLNQIYYAATIIIFIVSFYTIFKKRQDIYWPLALFPYIFAAYLTVISVVFSGLHRFHFPAMPWIFMTVAWALVYYLENSGVARREDQCSDNAASEERSHR